MTLKSVSFTSFLAPNVTARVDDHPHSHPIRKYENEPRVISPVLINAQAETVSPPTSSPVSNRVPTHRARGSSLPTVMSGLDGSDRKSPWRRQTGVSFEHSALRQRGVSLPGQGERSYFSDASDSDSELARADARMAQVQRGETSARLSTSQRPSEVRND